MIAEVIEAAGALEYAVSKLEAAAADAQRWVQDHDVPAPAGPRPTHGAWTSAPPTVRHVYLEFMSVVVWARGIQERLDNASPDRSLVRRVLRRIPLLRKRFPRPPRAGLANVLAAGQLRDEVRRAHAIYLKRTKEARLFANLGLHASRIQQNAGTAAAEVMDDLRIVFRIPDRVTRPVETFDEFTFAEGREAIGYVNDLLAAVDELLDAVLGAFERARPARFR
jgi:hypothetical protein